jgi:hypothetical protein
VKAFHFVLPDIPEQDDFRFLGSDSVIIPRYANLFDQGASKAKDFSRGYGFWGGISRQGISGRQPKYARQALGLLFCMGEAVPMDSNRVTIDSRRTDAWGVPTAHIEYEYQ